MGGEFLSAIPGIMLVRSDRLLLALAEQVAASREPYHLERFEREWRRRGRDGADPGGELALAVMRDYASDSYRLDDLQRALERDERVGWAPLDGFPFHYGYEFLAAVFGRHYRLQGNTVERQMAHSRANRDSLDHLHPFVVVGHELADRLHQHRLSFPQVVGYCRKVHELTFLAEADSDLPLADNHVHFGGAIQPATQLAAILRAPSVPGKWRAPGFQRLLPNIPEFQCLNAGTLRIIQVIDLVRIAYRFLRLLPWRQDRAGLCREGRYKVALVLRGGSRQPCPWVRELGGLRGEGSGRIPEEILERLRMLSREAEAQFREGEFSAFLLTTLVVCHLSMMERRLAEAHPFVRLFIHGIGILRSYMVMGHGTGLRWFSDFYDSALRNAEDQAELQEVLRGNNGLDRARGMYRAGVDKINARIGFDTFLDVERLGSLMEILHRAAREADGSGEAIPPGEPPVAYATTGLGKGSGCSRGFQFTLHYIRTLENWLPPSGDPCRQALEERRLERGRRWEKIQRQTLELDAFLSSPQSRRLPPRFLPMFGGGREMPGGAWRSWRRRCEAGPLDMTRLIAGIDVAGVEPDLPIEFFSPCILYLRRPHRQAEERSPLHSRQWRTAWRRRLPVHVHAGEDFSCLLTGIRAVDEALTFCELGPGDRIGHALALGLAPTLWLERHPNILVTREEYFDNMVWAWAMLVRILPRWPRAAALLPVYEYRVRDLAKVLHGPEAEARHPELWYRFWRFRAFSREALHQAFRPCWDRCDLPMQSCLRRGHEALHWDPIGQASLRRFAELAGQTEWIMKREDRHFFSLVNARRRERYRLRNEQCRPVSGRQWEGALPTAGRGCAAEEAPTAGWERYQGYANRLLSLHYDEHGGENDFSYERITPLEAEAWEVIQDDLMARLAKAGVAVEVCPSSNLAIAPIRSYAEHPIFRWSPPEAALLAPGARYNRFGIRGGPLDLCVNTDDPGIFNTTLAAEYRHLEKAATVDHGVAPARVREWLDGIRRRGNLFFDWTEESYRADQRWG
ncbi:MAG: hypothetical protein HQL59_00795 [Magnetococcales bacterium]|nr:hypothetical protein [Magnetococcales bacterium]